jgi:hypothetical protein
LLCFAFLHFFPSVGRANTIPLRLPVLPHTHTPTLLPLHPPFPHPIQSPLPPLQKAVELAKMVATTRTKTGHLPAKIEAAAVAPTATKKRATAANTSKPRDKKVAGGRVAKPKAKAVGKVDKGVGKVEGKPAKKVCCVSEFCCRGYVLNGC